MFKRISISILGAILLSGCSLLEDGNYFSQQEPINPNDLNESTDSALAAISSEQQVKENRKQIDQLSADWAELVKNVNRVVELDSELSYLLNALQKSEGLNSLTSSNLALNEYSAQVPENDAVTDKLSLSDAMDQLSNQIQSLPSKTNAQISPVIQKAKPILTDDGADNTKFSNSTGDAEQASASPNKNSQVGNKFTSIVGPTPVLTSGKFSQAIEPGSNCTNNPKGQNGNVAVHLISLKNQNNISTAADSLMNRFPNELCETSAKIENVSVNGESYYSLRFGPYANREHALSICSKLKAQGQYCGLTKFSGRTL